MTNAYLSNLRKELECNLDGYAKDFALECERNFTDYAGEWINDLINQFADSNVDVYYSKLLDFVKENPSSLEDVVDEGLYNPSVGYNFWAHAAAAQCMTIEQELQDNLTEIVRYLAVSYLWRIAERDYTEAEIDDLEDYLDPYAMSTFDEITEAVDNFMAEEE